MRFWSAALAWGFFTRKNEEPKVTFVELNPKVVFIRFRDAVILFNNLTGIVVAAQNRVC